MSTWFFLRGLVRESTHWDGFPGRFRSAFPGTETVELDLPGSGRHFEELSPCTVREMTDFVRGEFLRRKGEDNRLFTISLGGMVGVDWMQRYPKDFSGAVLVNTSMRGLSPFYRRLRPENYPTILRLILSRHPALRERRILEMTSNRADRYDRVAAEWAEIQRLRPVSVPNAIRQILAAASYSPSREKPAAEILVMSSLTDRLVHPSCSDRLAELWNLKHVTHPSAGHDLTLDDAEWALAQVKTVFSDREQDVDE